MAQMDIARTTDVRSLSAGDASLANSFSGKAFAEAGSPLPTTEQAVDPFARFRIGHAYDTTVAALVTTENLDPEVRDYLTLPTPIDPVTTAIARRTQYDIEDGELGPDEQLVGFDPDKAAVLRGMTGQFVPGHNNTLLLRRSHGDKGFNSGSDHYDRTTDFDNDHAQAVGARARDERRLLPKDITEGVIEAQSTPAGATESDEATKSDENTRQEENGLPDAKNGQAVEVYVADSIYDVLPVDEDEVAEIEAAYEQRLTRSRINPKAYHELR